MEAESQKNKLPEQGDEITLKEIIFKLKDWWQYLLSKWLIILSFGIVGATLGFAFSFFNKPVYFASTNFVLEDEKSGGGLSSLAGLASMAGVDLGNSGGSIFQGDNILELYKSKKMIKNTLFTPVTDGNKSDLLINYYIEFNGLRKNWEKNPDLKAIKFEGSALSKLTRVQDSIIGIITNDINKNYLTVSKPDKKLTIIRAEVKAKNEFFAKNFNEQIVKNVNDFYVRTKIKKSLENVIILEQKADSVRSVMNGAIYSAAAVADATPNLNPTRQRQRIAPVQRSQFSVETNKAILSTLIQNLEMAKVSLRKEAPLIQIIDSPIYPLDKQSFGKLKGIVVGAILFGFLSSLFLLIKKIFKEIIQ